MIQQKKRYFVAPENYVEWFVMLLAVANIVMTFDSVVIADRSQWQRHLGAFCILLAFIQLYLLLVRIAPNTPIPVYINMFTTVLKTYTFILLSYFAFIMSFSYSFYLIFGYQRASQRAQQKVVRANFRANTSTTTVTTAQAHIDIKCIVQKLICSK